MSRPFAFLFITTVNNAIRERGIEAELVRGDGYFYFTGDDVQYAKTGMVMVPRLNDLPLARWMDELNQRVEESKARAADLADLDVGGVIKLRSAK